jgi:hypothetical protein
MEGVAAEGGSIGIKEGVEVGGHDNALDSVDDGTSGLDVGL